MNRLSALPWAGCALILSATLGFSATKAVDLKRDVRAAKSVVTGEVDRVYSYFGSDGEIYSDITVRVSAVLKQELETPDTITFTIPGGEVGDVGVLFTGAPQFAQNEPVMVFLKTGEDGKTFAAAKYEMDGRYIPEVKMTAAELLRSVSAELEEIGEPIRESEWRRASDFLERSANTRKTPPVEEFVLNAGDATCYKLMGPKWRVPSVTYKLDSSLPAGFAAAINLAVAPFNASGVPLRLSVNPFSANVVSYGAISGEGVLAQTRVQYQPSTSTIVGFTLVYNRSFPWGFAGESNKFDVQGIGTHEFGHAVGLNHPDPASCNDQTMWFSAGPGETNKRTLEVGDLAGMTALYGAAPTPSAPPPSTPAPTPPPAPIGSTPPVPVLSNMTTSGSLATNSPIRLIATGTSFTTNGLQFVIRGAGCPTPTGCVIDYRSLQGLTTTDATAVFTPRGGGAFTVTLRNTAYGAESSASFRFNVAIVVRR